MVEIITVYIIAYLIMKENKLFNTLTHKICQTNFNVLKLKTCLYKEINKDLKYALWHCRFSVIYQGKITQAGFSTDK